ncbi:hypothetical protein HYT02_05845 [Candidatus Gottesmanbacteria bacterium]|nr:hypothetical protein [Candidatus Gottesmanbacteria bacterium]
MRKENPVNYKNEFRLTSIGKAVQMPLSNLTPTQPFDGKLNTSTSPIEACFDNGSILIIHGNHRYWTAIKEYRDEVILLPVIKVSNPYLDF